MSILLDSNGNRFSLRDMGKSLRFDGTSAYLKLAPTYLNVMNSPSNSFSFACWLRHGNGGRIFSESNTSTGVPVWDLYPDSTNPRKLQLWVKNDAGSVLRLTTTTDEMLNGYGQWTHLVVTDLNGTIKMYKDGVLKTAGVSYTRSGVFTMNRTQLGARSISSPSAFLRGNIDDFRLWKGYILTQSDVYDIFYRGLNPSTAPTAWYKMDEGSGTTVADSTGNGNTATITAATFSNDVPILQRSAQSGRIAASGRTLINF